MLAEGHWGAAVVFSEVDKMAKPANIDVIKLIVAQSTVTTASADYQPTFELGDLVHYRYWFHTSPGNYDDGTTIGTVIQVHEADTTMPRWYMVVWPNNAISGPHFNQNLAHAA